MSDARNQATRAHGLLTPERRLGERHRTPPTELDVARAQARALTGIAFALADLADLARAAAPAEQEEGGDRG